jgi:hypothetical protein
MSPKPQLFRWLLSLVIIVGILAGGAFELLYRRQVLDSQEMLMLREWVKESAAIKALVGEVTVIEPQRRMTSFAVGSAGSDGRFNLRVVGKTGEKSVLVTWYRRKGDPTITVQKVENASFYRELLWENPSASRGLR